MASELEVGKVKIAATDGQFGLVHENATGIKVGTDTNTTIGFIGTISNHPLKLMTNNGGHVTVATDGLATFSQRIHGVGGISFGQTNSSATGAAATSTILDHYEEGTWTTDLTFGNSNTGITYASSSNKGIYTRIGQMVYISCIVELTSKGSETGNALIGGLPFPVADKLAATSLENSLTSAYSNIGLAHAYAAGSTPNIYLRNSSHANMTNSDFSNSSSLRVSGWYITT